VSGVTDVEAGKARELICVNPASGERIGAVAASTAADVARAVSDVADVQTLWRQLPLPARARQLRRAARTLLDLGSEASDLIAREQGRPVTEAWTGEVVPAVRAMRWMSTAGRRELTSRRVRGNPPWPLPLRSTLAVEPLAVVISELDIGSPWRAAAERAGAALIAGAGVVLAPSPRCALVGDWFGQTMSRAGVPEGLIRVVQGFDPGASTLAAAGADRLLGPAPLTGGHRGAADAAAPRAGAAMLVLDDADVDLALAAASWGAFAHAGQGPFAIRRVFLASKLGERFVEGLAWRATQLRIGDPQRWDTEVGPLADREALGSLQAELDAALQAGATRHCGGAVEVTGLGGAFCAPVVLSGSDIERSVPGPAVAVTILPSEADALAEAAAGGPWSALSVWAGDVAKAARVAADVPTGSVWINAHDPSLDPAALTLALNAGVRRRPLGVGVGRDARWYPYADTVGPGARAVARLLYGRESERTRIAVNDRSPLMRAARRALRSRGR